MKNWMARVEAVDAALDTGRLRLRDLQHPPAAPTYEQARAEIAANPPLEGEYIAARILDKDAFVLPTLAVLACITVVASAAVEVSSHGLDLLRLGGDIVGGLFLSFLIMLMLGATLQRVLPSLLNNFLKPVNIEAAAARRFAEMEAEHDTLVQAAEVWRLSQSMRPWHEADGPTFERLVARTLRKQGWHVELVGGANDGGVDIRISREELLVLVQCKAHARPIPPGALRDLYGALVHEGAGGAVLVCRSGVSRAARAWISGKPIMVLTPEELVAAGGVPIDSGGWVGWRHS